MPKKPVKKTTKKVERPNYICVRCEKEKREDQYFKSHWSKMWVMNDKKVLICKECINALFDEYTNRYGESTSLKICCSHLDIPYSGVVYKGIIEKNNIFNVGMYVRTMQLQQYKNQSFVNSLIDGELFKGELEIKEEVEAKWSRIDKQNMNFVLTTIGYDPFNDCNMTDNDRRYCFNILANYCDTDGIQEDGHKIQSVIQITQSQLQCRKLDEFINSELLSPSPEDNRIKQLSATKKQLLDSIAKIAQDNNLSSNYNDNSKKGINALSSKMKELSDNNFEAIKVNLFDIKTSEAMRQIADLSHQSIMEQLSLDANDYIEMVKEQKEIILKFESENDNLKEENRILKNEMELIKLSSKRKKVGG